MSSNNVTTPIKNVTSASDVLSAGLDSLTMSSPSPTGSKLCCPPCRQYEVTTEEHISHLWQDHLSYSMAIRVTLILCGATSLFLILMLTACIMYTKYQAYISRVKPMLYHQKYSQRSARITRWSKMSEEVTPPPTPMLTPTPTPTPTPVWGCRRGLASSGLS